MAREIYKIPVVATIHGGGEITRIQQKTLGKTRLRIFRTHVDRFIAIDQDIDKQLARLGIPKQLRAWIPNGVDVEHFCPVSRAQKERLRAEFHLAESPVVVFTGRLVSLKRVDQLISAWAIIRQSFPKATLLIIGTGPEENALKRAAYPEHPSPADVQDDGGTGIIFLGEVQDVAPYLQTADLFVFPSSREGLSVSLLEAMACELATIATDVGGNIDLIHHQQTGWLVPGDDRGEFPTRLAEAIRILLEDKDLRERIAQAGRKHIVQSYSLASVVKLLHALYFELSLATSPVINLDQSGRRT